MDINIRSAEDAREWAEFFADMGADVEMNFIVQDTDSNAANNAFLSGENNFINRELITDNLLKPNDWVKKGNSWSREEDITSAEQAKAAGYEDCRAPGSIIDNARIGDRETGSVYLGLDKTDFSYTPSNKEVTPWQVGSEWLTGAGPRQTMQSASRPPVIGYYPAWHNTVGRKINNSFKSGWGSKTSQSFIWTETLKLKK